MKKITTVTALAMAVCCSHTVFASQGEQYDDLHKLTNNKSAVDAVPTKELSDRAFEALLEEMYPASPDQLKRIQRKQKQFDSILYDNKQPDAITDIIQVSTRPGAKPVEIFVAPFHTSSLNVIDSTGQPWPITSVMYGNDLDYKVSKVEGHAYANIVRVDAQREYGTTNMNLSLVDLPVTITVTMKNNTKKYHPSPILQIDKEGPQAKSIPAFSIDSVNSDQVLKQIVLGLAPQAFEKLVTSDSNVEAWRHEGSLYLRTTYQPSSPLPRGIHHGPANYSAYRLSDIPILVLTTDQGFEKTVTVEEAAQ